MLYECRRCGVDFNEDASLEKDETYCDECFEELVFIGECYRDPDEGCR